MTTVWQRASLFLWHWRTGGVDDSYLRKLWDAGARCIAVQLQDDGPIPRERVDAWRGRNVDGTLIAGVPQFKVHGVFHPFSSGDESRTTWAAEQAAEYAHAEKRRLRLDGIRCNFEDEVEAEDWRTAGEWSRRFCTEFRRRMPRLPAALDTYYGARGMNLDAYRAAGFRLVCQVYDGDGLWRDPPTSFVEWTAERGWPRGYVRPEFGVIKRDGVRIDLEMALDNAKRAGTLGVNLYYIDGAFDVLDEYLVPFVRRAIELGVAR